MKTPRQLLRDEVALIAIRHGVPVEDVYAKGGDQRIVNARNAAYYHLRSVHGMTYPEIGAHFGRDHTSAVHGVGRHLEINNIFDPKLDHLRVFVATRRRNALLHAAKKKGTS